MTESIIDCINCTCYYFSIVPEVKKLKRPNDSMSFKWNAPEVLSLASQGALYIMTHLPFPSPKMESTVIRHIVACDDENSDTDDFEVNSLCSFFVKIIVCDLYESIFQIQRLTGLCKCLSLCVL